MHLPFNKIFSQAGAIIRHQKFLLMLGLFLVSGNMLNYGLSTLDMNPETNTSSGTYLSHLSQGWQNMVGAGVFLLFIILFILFFRSKAAVIASVKAIVDKQPTSFSIAMRASSLFYSRILIVTILIELGLIVLSLILGGTIVNFIGQKEITQAWILGIFGGLIFLPVLVVAALVNVLAPLFIVIFDLKIQEAISRSYELITAGALKLLGFGLILWVLEFLPFVLFAFFTYYNHDLALNIIALIALFILEIWIQTFKQTAWVLAFLELIKPQKIEEEILPVPEVV